jgi:hypothetical protein
MCKLCERDKGKMYPGTVTDHIAEDRLAVLERDHRAMERLRLGGIDALNHSYYGWTLVNENKSLCPSKQDPADAILAEGE